MQFARALIASFLPSRQRRRWGLEGSVLLQRSAFWGAILQAALLGYFSATALIRQLQTISPEDPLPGLRSGIYAAVIHPLTMCAVLLALEGIARALIVACIGEVYPTLPMALLSGILQKRIRTQDRGNRRLLALHPRWEDRVEQVGDKLVIATARTKPDWSDAAICVAGLYYKAGGPHPGQHGLPHTYILRPWPDGLVIRKILYYEGPGFGFGGQDKRAS